MNNVGELFDEKNICKEIDFDRIEDVCNQITDEIKNILEGTGIYFQIISRVKSPKSISTKLMNGNYQFGQKHLQDLIGIRIIFYYYDDITIVKEILENVFNLLDIWAESNNDVDKFKATKRNGVFVIPEECMRLYPKGEWKLPIDKTFEIQLRTMGFEGWHEVEHDMRYKKSDEIGDMWEDNYNLSRMLNCVLANLELCDWSLINLFDQLGQNNLNAGNVEAMIKSRFRLKMKDEQIHPELSDILKRKPELIERIYTCSRQKLIRELLKHERPIITPSYIIRMLNDAVLKDEEISAVCDSIQWKKVERVQQRNEHSRIQRYPAFNYDVILRNDEGKSLEEIIRLVADIIYKWVYNRFSKVFDMQEETSNYQSETPGYKLSFKYDIEKKKINLHAMNIDLERAGTLWNVHSECSEIDGRIRFTAKVSCDSIHVLPEQQLFSKPHFVNEIGMKLGYSDIESLDSEIVRIYTKDEFYRLKSLVEAKRRKMPIIVVCQEGNEKDKVLIKITSLAKSACDYAHIYYAGNEVFEQIRKLISIGEQDMEGSVIVFWKNGAENKFDFYSRELILNSQFDFNRFVYTNGHIYDKAFRRKLLRIIKKHNRTDG